MVSPSICHEVMGLDAMILFFFFNLPFLNVDFLPALSLSFTFIKRFFSSSLSTVRVVSFAYPRLLIFLLAILIPAYASSSPALCMMYSAYKLNKHGDNIQPWRTPFPIWNQSVVPRLVLTVASWPIHRFLRRQVKWSGEHEHEQFSSLLWSTQVKGFGVINKRTRCFSGILWLFLWSNGCWQFDLWFFCLF